jgi:hypothetical protein
MIKTLQQPEWQLDLERRAEEAERVRVRRIVASVLAQPKPVPKEQLFGMAVFFALLGALVAACVFLSSTSWSSW